jgi:hypothetical protein
MGRAPATPPGHHVLAGPFKNAALANYEHDLARGGSGTSGTPTLIWEAVVVNPGQPPVVRVGQALWQGQRGGLDKTGVTTAARAFVTHHPGAVLAVSGRRPDGYAVEGFQVWSDASGRVMIGNEFSADGAYRVEPRGAGGTQRINVMRVSARV